MIVFICSLPFSYCPLTKPLIQRIPLERNPSRKVEEVSSSNFIVLNGTLAFTTIELIISEVR